MEIIGQSFLAQPFFTRQFDEIRILFYLFIGMYAIIHFAFQ